MNEITLSQKQHDDIEVNVDQSGSTFLIIAAQHKDPARNGLNRVTCKRGIPMGGHVFDSKQDCYFLPCVDYLLVGTVNAAAYAVSKSNGWSIRIPLALSIIPGLLTDSQKADLKHFVESYDPEQYAFKYLQLIDASESYPPVKQ